MGKEMDPNVYNYFVRVVKKRQGDLDDKQVEQVAVDVYGKFSDYLLQEFRKSVRMNSAQIAALKESISSGQSSRTMQNLAVLVKTNTGQELNELLVSILDDFVQNHF